MERRGEESGLDGERGKERRIDQGSEREGGKKGGDKERWERREER